MTLWANGEEIVDPEVKRVAEELVRGQQLREWRFRSNVILAILIMLVVFNIWRAYRNESIWNRCLPHIPPAERSIFND